MNATKTRPTISEVLGTLDELAAATRTRDLDRYTAALEVAHDQDLSDEQIRDSYDWGGRTSGHRWPNWDWRGSVRHV